MGADYEWVGIRRVKPSLPPYIVERRPYSKCPRCEKFQYRPVYDGRTEESVGKCRNCEYKDELVTSVPDRYVHDANMKLADATLVILALAFLTVLISLVLTAGGAL